MSAHAIDELREFHRFLSDKVGGDVTDLSPEEALDAWRRLHPSTEAFAEDVAAIKEALDDMKNGERGIPFDQFDRDFRAQHNIPA